MRKPTSEPRGVAMPRELWTRAKRFAGAETRRTGDIITVSATIRKALREYLDKNEQAEAAR